MPTTTIRRFSLLDSLVLVAATAAGIAGSREEWVRLWQGRWFVENREGGSLWIVVIVTREAFSLGLPCLVAWTFALLLLRLKRPRPRLSRLILQPGTAACAAAAFSLFIGVALNLQEGFVLSFVADSCEIVSLGWWELTHNAIETTTPLTATAVLVAWMILGCSRLGRCEPSWIDRVGRIIGFLWIPFFYDNLIGNLYWYMEPGFR